MQSIQYNIIQLIQYNTTHHNTYKTIQYNTTHTIQHNTIHHNTYNTIQYNTVQYNTIQYAWPRALLYQPLIAGLKAITESISQPTVELDGEVFLGPAAEAGREVEDVELGSSGDVAQDVVDLGVARAALHSSGF